MPQNCNACIHRYSCSPFRKAYAKFFKCKSYYRKYKNPNWRFA